MDDLKPCPFCQCPKLKLAVRYSNRNYRFVECLACDARGPEHRKDQDAIDGWNSAKVADG